MKRSKQSHWRSQDWRPYANKKARSDYLLDIIPPIEKDAAILEVGCNCGRNLWWLQQSGYTSLAGIDINEAALNSGYFKLKADLQMGDIESQPLPYKDGQFDLVFTMAVLEHIYNDRILDEIVRVSKEYVLEIEDEDHETATHKIWDYSKEFQKRGLIQLWLDQRASAVFGGGFKARLFRKVEK